jgi:hypothetical protein
MRIGVEEGVGEFIGSGGSQEETIGDQFAQRLAGLVFVQVERGRNRCDVYRRKGEAAVREIGSSGPV